MMFSATLPSTKEMCFFGSRNILILELLLQTSTATRAFLSVNLSASQHLRLMGQPIVLLERNSVEIGGGRSVSGISPLPNLSFKDMSGEGGGPAISNGGTISK